MKSKYMILGFLLMGTLYFGGDYLIFSYTLGGTMISLTYMKPRGIAVYVWVISVIQLILMLGFGMNLMGASFTMPQNYGALVASVGLSIMIYFYAKIYYSKNAFFSISKPEKSNTSTS